MRRPATASAVAVILALGACAGEPSGETPDRGLESTPDEGAGDGADDGAASEVPDFSFETFEGETFSLAEQRGTPVVLNFWESW